MSQKPTIFEFTSYQFMPSENKAVFHYKTEFVEKEPLFFSETIILPKIPKLNAIPKELLDNLLKSLHLILGISYYKFYCPPAIALAGEGVTLSKKEADFWSTVYKNGLGEFFYKNNLDPKISPKFPFSKNSTLTKPYTLGARPSQKCLVGIGGGKDSIVAAELLKEHGFDMTAFVVETHSADSTNSLQASSGQAGKEFLLVEKIISIIGTGDLKIERQLDQKIHDRHLYNGHIPISAIYAFLGVFMAALYDYSYVIVGNEHSSNFGNTEYKGLQINHQWSKSFEFETLFQNYLQEFITPDIMYFSLLRSFYEIRVVKMFAKYKQYFPYFSSCNKNFRIEGKTHQGLWCGQCPKCVFVFTLLSAFLSKKELVNMFGKNLYEDEALLPLFKDVLGFGTMKPFDCVGTFEEAQTALFLAKNKLALSKAEGFAGDFIMRQLGKRAKYHKEVFQTNKETAIPAPFTFLGMETAYILGYGKEGKISKQYLKKYYPKIKVGIGDGALDKNYLKKQEQFDIAIKTPGIKKDLVTIPYTTATNIFFSKIKNKNLIIGVTGSKGKSTTSSLIYKILKESGKNVRLLGNIGIPMLQDLLKPIDKNTIFVLEISDAQLSDIAYSPDIAVVTNLFPEHMDYHGSLENYYKAKRNIINFQNKTEHFIYNPKNKLMLGWLKGYIGKALPFAKNIPLKDNEIHLLGEHNKNNIKAAVATAKLLKVSDQAIKTAIKKFKGLPHRLEFVGEFKGIKFYDDAISTTPDSTIMAIKALPKIGTIFLGGQDRGYNFVQLEKTIKKYKIKNVVLFPDSGNRMIKNPGSLNILKTKSMKEAVQFAYKNTKPGQVCLLSCASPSYSLWKNFEEKGDQFKFFVKKFSKS